MSPSWNQFCFLQPKQLSTVAKQVFATEFNIDTAQAGELIVEGVDLLHVRPPLLGGDSRPNQIAHSDILSSPTKLQLIKVFCCSLFFFTASSTLANHTFDVCWKTLQSGSTESNWWRMEGRVRCSLTAFCILCTVCAVCAWLLYVHSVHSSPVSDRRCLPPAPPTVSRYHGGRVAWYCSLMVARWHNISLLRWQNITLTRWQESLPC